jgi:hypothetical protein
MRRSHDAPGRYLQHWLGGAGPRLHVADFVPDTHPIRQWADSFPWASLVAAVEHRFATRFLKRSPRGRAPIPIRVLLALELLKHEVGASDEDICHRLRTDFAQFIRICRWLKLHYKEQLAPLENAPFSCNGLENDAEQPSVSASIDELQTAIN